MTQINWLKSINDFKTPQLNENYNITLCFSDENVFLFINYWWGTFVADKGN